MNTQLTKANKFIRPVWYSPFVKIATRKNSLQIRQLFLIGRIVVLLFTTGLIGYSVDRALQLFQKPASSS